MAEKETKKNKVEKSDKVDKLVEILMEKELKQIDEEKKEKEEKAEREKTADVLFREARENMKKQLREDKYLPYRIKAESSKAEYPVELIGQDGKMVKYMSYGLPWHHKFNGYYYAVPKGVSLMLPETVVKQLEKADAGELLSKEQIDKRLLNGALEEE